MNNRKPPTAPVRGSTRPIRGGHPPQGSGHLPEVKGDGSSQSDHRRSVRGRSQGGGVFPQGPHHSQHQSDDYQGSWESHSERQKDSDQKSDSERG